MPGPSSAWNLITHFFDRIDNPVERHRRFVEAHVDGASRDIDIHDVDSGKLGDGPLDRRLAVVAGDSGHGECSGSDVWLPFEGKVNRE